MTDPATKKAVRWVIEAVISKGLIKSFNAIPEPTDPRERSLYLREHRNTGPVKNPHERARR